MTARARPLRALSGSWDPKQVVRQDSAAPAAPAQTGKQKTVYQTLPAKLLWKKHPLSGAAGPGVGAWGHGGMWGQAGRRARERSGVGWGTRGRRRRPPSQAGSVLSVPVEGQTPSWSPAWHSVTGGAQSFTETRAGPRATAGTQRQQEARQTGEAVNSGAADQRKGSKFYKRKMK